MLSAAALSLVFNAMLCLGAPIYKREVPQEHSHEKFLTSVRTSLQRNNPARIVDPVFGLLGNAAAAGGAGSITDLDCLHQATADQAFTNAKAAGDVQGQVDALIYAALERNTGSVGLASNACTGIKAVNPEIAAISQHQDPASPNAAAINKKIVLALAQQIKAVGGDPQDALQSGTFAPGKIGDPTAAGNSCDDANDPVGCIFTKKLLVNDATPDEINAAVGGGSAKSASSTQTTTTAATATADATASPTCPPAATVTVYAAASTATTPSGSGSGSGSSTLNFGSCSNPTIEFGLGFDGRKDNSFQPENQKDFNHGSALNIKVITDFICQQLNDKCKAPQATIDACNAGAAAAIPLSPSGAAADTFNKAVGSTSNFAQNPIKASSS